MKSLVLLLSFLFLLAPSFGQDCYKEAPLENMKLDYCDLWSGYTFQGTIGDDNQRIELRFIEISQNSADCSQYFVQGKSRVHNNVCDFEGVVIIDRIMLLDMSNGGCGEPYMSDGILYGTYSFKENPEQLHVGQFKGEFKSMFDKRENRFVVNTGWLGQEDFNCFMGTWQEYHQTENRYCAWGVHIPPSKQENLFKHYDEAFYLFNSKYMDKGWKTYVLSNLNLMVKVPKDYETNELRLVDDFMGYSIDEIEQAIREEKKKWWE